MAGGLTMSSHIPTAADIRREHEDLGAQLNAALGALDENRAAMSRIDRDAGDESLTASQQRSWDALKGQGDALEQLRDEVTAELAEWKDERAERVRSSRSQWGSTQVGQSPDGVPSTDPLNQSRSAAMRLVDKAVAARQLPEHAAEKVERLVSDGSEGDRGLAARWVVAAGAPAYRSAFAKLCADPVRGHLMWSPQELDAYQRVGEVRAAMSLTDANGGYMVPLTLDPAIMLTSDGSNNPLRSIARVVQTVTDTWQGVTSAGATSEWKAEGAEAADGAPVVDDAPIPVHFGDTFVPYSFEVGMDAVNFLNELQRVMADSAGNLQSAGYTTGTGTGQPKGFVTALAGTSSEINTTGTEAIVASDAFALQNALPARFSGRAQWCAHIATINTFRQFETTNGALKFPELANGQLLGKPMNECSNMDGSINAAATANNYVLAYGDWQNFVIVDRIGTQLEFIPNLVGANRRPSGQRGAFLWFRTGSDVVVPQAFRMLDVPTTA